MVPFVNLYRTASRFYYLQNESIDNRLAFRSHTNVWAIEGLRDAAMTPEESVHYRLETEAGATEWASTLPQGKGIVSVPGKNGLFRLAMFHQLECLGVIRASMMDRMKNPSGPSTSEVAHFCLNYLRQSIQCHTDVHLEMVRSEYGGRAVLPYTTRTDCRDWEQVWHQAEGNFDVWSKRSLFNML